MTKMRSKFLEEFERFLQCLTNARASLEGHSLTLTHIDLGMDVTSISPSQYTVFGMHGENLYSIQC